MPEARRDLEALTLIDAVAAVPAGGTLFDALMDQLALVESLAGPVERARALSATAGHYVLAGEAGSVTVSLSGTVCTAEPGSLEIDLVGRQARWHVEFSSAAAAFPAAISRHDADGARTRRPLFQGWQRARWLRLHEEIDAQEFDIDPLNRLIVRAECAAVALDA